MGILHKKRSGIPAGDPAGLVGGTNWLDDHTHVPFEIAMILSTTAALTPAAASAAANTELYATSKTCRNVVDLAAATQARLVAQVIATGNAAGGSYKLSFATTQASTWAGADAGPICVVGTNGGAAGIMHDSGWVNLAAGAKVDNCYITALVGTALGTTAPTIGSLTVFFR
jgi:hypothetical protein